jgi:uncharacterized protein YacL
MTDTVITKSITDNNSSRLVNFAADHPQAMLISVIILVIIAAILVIVVGYNYSDFSSRDLTKFFSFKKEEEKKLDNLIDEIEHKKAKKQ